MGTIYLKRKLYTQWDETDNLKRMKDSDILAEKKKKGPGYGSVLSSAAGGAIAGATTGAIALGLHRGIKNKSWAGAASGLKSGGKYGALIGGTLMAAGALKRKNKADQENKFYNDRLEYAQRQALRREHADWRSNMTQREGYSY